MKLDGLFEHEFNKLSLKKVRLKTDPKKPLLEYEGYILKEDRKFLKMHEGLISAISKGYSKLQDVSQKVKSIGQGNLGAFTKLAIKKKPLKRPIKKRSKS